MIFTPRSLSEFGTTLTELNAIAPVVNIGLSKPKAAPFPFSYNFPAVPPALLCNRHLSVLLYVSPTLEKYGSEIPTYPPAKAKRRAGNP